MIKVKVSELSGPALDWAVAKAEGLAFVIRSGRPAFVQEFDPELSCNEDSLKEWKCWTYFQPSTDWSDTGPLIDKYDPDERRLPERDRFAEVWLDRSGGDIEVGHGRGPTRLIAFCRALVNAKLGKEIEIPDELLTQS